MPNSADTPGPPMSASKIVPDMIRSMKGRQRIASLTAYDYPTCKLLDEVGVPLILVGDSLGMVVLGYRDTTEVTLADMEHHVAAAARARPQALLAADLPYRTYESTGDAVAHSKRLVAAGAEAVKAEGGRVIAPQVRAIVGEGIPFIGHLGMLPQHVREEGGYRRKGKSDVERDALLLDAAALVEAGAFAIVVELVASETARALTQSVAVPTIGIGSGPHCDGQILVTPDLLGTSPGYIPKHVTQSANLRIPMTEAIKKWKSEVQAQ